MTTTTTDSAALAMIQAASRDLKLPIVRTDGALHLTSRDGIPGFSDRI